jgi:hypothetical protein
MFTYTSPLTNVTYDIQFKDNRWARYEIRLDGQLVQFALEEGAIPEQVAWFENPGADIGSRYD